MPSIERPEPTLIPPRVVASATGNVYDPGLALRTPLTSMLRLAPTLIPPSVPAAAIGKVYSDGIVGLFRISPRPDVASQSGCTGAVLPRVILLLAPSHVTVVPPLPAISISSSLLLASRRVRMALLLVVFEPSKSYVVPPPAFPPVTVASIVLLASLYVTVIPV